MKSGSNKKSNIIPFPANQEHILIDSISIERKPIENNLNMTVSRYELDAKCQAIEATMDARVQKMEVTLNSAVSDFKATTAEIKADMREIRNELKNTKWQVLFLCVGLFAAVIGILAITNSWQQTNLSIMTNRLDKVTDTLNTTNQSLEKIILKR